MEERRSKEPTFVQKMKMKKKKLQKEGKPITHLEMSKISERSAEHKIDTVYGDKPLPDFELDWDHPFWRDPNKPAESVVPQ